MAYYSGNGGPLTKKSLSDAYRGVRYELTRIIEEPMAAEFLLEIDGFGSYSLLFDFDLRGHELALVKTTVLKNDHIIDLDYEAPIIRHCVESAEEEIEGLHIMHFEKEVLEAFQKSKG